MRALKHTPSVKTSQDETVTTQAREGIETFAHQLEQCFLPVTTQARELTTLVPVPGKKRRFR